MRFLAEKMKGQALMLGLFHYWSCYFLHHSEMSYKKNMEPFACLVVDHLTYNYQYQPTSDHLKVDLKHKHYL